MNLIERLSELGHTMPSHLNHAGASPMSMDYCQHSFPGIQSAAATRIAFASTVFSSPYGVTADCRYSRIVGSED